MSKSDFVPASDVEFASWHNQFKGAVSLKTAESGLSAADLAQIEADNAELHDKIAAANLAAAAHKQATAEKKMARERIEAGVRSYARRIKAQTGYQPALGSLFGIEGPDIVTDFASYKPNLSGSDHTGGMVILSFSKLKSDGINLYGQRDGDADWVLLAHASSSPYTDLRPLLQTGKPELRRYSAIYVQKQVEVGLFSDEVVVNCAP
jgi:hypothetical protein